MPMRSRHARSHPAFATSYAHGMATCTHAGVRYAYYRDRHDGYNEEAARKDVEAAWDVLRAYQVAAGVAANMTNLRAGMTTDCARV
jgi:hypothetical protein